MHSMIIYSIKCYKCFNLLFYAICIQQAYGMSMENQASKMAVQVDQLLGDVLCPDIETGEMIVFSVIVGALFDDEKVG